MLTTPATIATFLAPDLIPADELTRRGLLGGFAAIGLLAACGTDGDLGRTDDAATRTVTDDDGRNVEIPVEPKRVVMLNEEHAAHVTTLGYVPHGQAWVYQPDFVETLTEFGGDTGDLSSVGDAGSGETLDYEKILVLGPDLIIGWPGQDDEALERLTAIAPYVGVDARTNRDGVEFAQVRFLADLVGVSEQAEARIAAYRTALAAFRESYGRELADLDYTYLDVVGNGILYTYNLPGYAVNAVMAGLGVPMSAAMRTATDEALGFPDDPDSGYATFSVELAAEYDAGLVFIGSGVEVLSVDAVPDDVRAALTGTHALAEDQVFPVVTNLWTFHLLEANLTVLRELEAFFAGPEIAPRPA